MDQAKYKNKLPGIYDLFNFILKISVIAFSLFASIVIIFPFNNYGITSRSIKELGKLNLELQNLREIAGKKYSNLDQLKFDARNLISPDLFNKYYYLDEFIYSQNYDKTFTYDFQNIMNDIKPEFKSNIHSKKKYFEVDSLLADIKKMTISSSAKLELADTIGNLEIVYKVYPIKDLIIPDSILTKLNKIRNLRFRSDDSFNQAISNAIGLNNFRFYGRIINDSSNWMTTIVKTIGLTLIIIFAISLLSIILLSKYSPSNLEKNKFKEFDQKIQIAEESISKNPNDFQPIWDLAYNTLQQYYSRNLKQINSIYTLSVSVMVAGFVLIVGIIIISYIKATSVEIKQLGIIAGIITEFIGATFILIYKSTIQQAIKYSKSLEEINKVGMAIKIINSIENNEINKEKIENAKIAISQKLLSNDSGQ